MLSPRIHGLQPRELYASVAVTAAPVRVPTQWLLVPSLMYADADTHGAMGCNHKSFIILVVWRSHQLMSWSLPNGHFSRISDKLGWEILTLPLYITWILCTITTTIHGITKIKIKRETYRKNEEYSRWKTNKIKEHMETWYILTHTEVLINQKRKNVCEHILIKAIHLTNHIN